MDYIIENIKPEILTTCVMYCIVGFLNDIVIAREKCGLPEAIGRSIFKLLFYRTVISCSMIFHFLILQSFGLNLYLCCALSCLLIFKIGSIPAFILDIVTVILWMLGKTECSALVVFGAPVLSVGGFVIALLVGALIGAITLAFEKIFDKIRN